MRLGTAARPSARLQPPSESRACLRGAARRTAPLDPASRSPQTRGPSHRRDRDGASVHVIAARQCVYLPERRLGESERVRPRGAMQPSESRDQGKETHAPPSSDETVQVALLASMCASQRSHTSTVGLEQRRAVRKQRARFCNWPSRAQPPAGQLPSTATRRQAAEWTTEETIRYYTPWIQRIGGGQLEPDRGVRFLVARSHRARSAVRNRACIRRLR